MASNCKAAIVALILAFFGSGISAAPTNLNVTISGGADYIAALSVTLSLFADNTSASTNCSLSNDGSAWPDQFPYTTSYSWNLTAGDGAKTVYFRCSDDGANWTSAVSDSIILDTLPPNITSVSPANGSIASSARPSFSISVFEAGSGINSSSIVLSIDGSPASASYSSGTISFTPGSDMTESAHSASVTVYDNSGKSASVSWSFFIDKPPAFGALSPENGVYLKSIAPTISVAVSDSGSGINSSRFLLTIDGLNSTGNATYSSGTFSAGVTLSEGRHTVTVTAYDNSGVSASISWNFTIDKTEPVFGTITPADKSEQNSVASISISMTDSVSGINRSSLLMKLDSKDVTGETAYSSGVFYYLPGKLAGGNHVVEVWASDNTGNTAYKMWIFSIFSTAPAIDSLNPADGAVLNSSKPAVSARVTDSGTGGLDLGTLKIFLDGSDVTGQAQFDDSLRVISYTPQSALSEGNHSADVRISDKIGNFADKAWTFIIDTIPPGKPANLTVIAAAGRADLSWSMPTDGAVAYRIFRSPSVFNSVAGMAKLGDSSTTSYSDTSVSGKAYYAVMAVDAAGNQGEPAFAGTCADYENGWVDYACCSDSDCSANMLCNMTSHSCAFPAEYTSKLDAEAKIDEVRSEIEIARSGGKNVTIAEGLLAQSSTEYNAGNYSGSLSLAGQAQSALLSAPDIPIAPAPGGKKPLCGGGFALAILLAASAGMLREKGEHKI